MNCPGGIIAIKPCGCVRGWVLSIDGAEDRKMVAEWVMSGATVGPLVGECPPFKCAAHKKELVKQAAD